MVINEPKITLNKNFTRSFAEGGADLCGVI